MEASLESDELESRAHRMLAAWCRGSSRSRRVPRPEERVRRVLQSSEGGVARANMLPEAELAAWSQDSPQLVERGGGRRRSENPHQHRRVELAVRCQ